MNVLFLTRSYYPNIGGVEKHIYKLSKALIKKGIYLTIITEKSYSNDYQSSTPSDRQLGEGKVKIVRIKTGSSDWLKKFRIWKELLSHISLIKKADIIHAHDVYFWYFPFRLIFPLKKSFVTFHGYEGDNLPSFKAILMHKLSEVLANGNICVGKFLTKWYKTKPTYVTYGAVDKKLLNTTKKSQLQRNKGIFIGRLEQETGILEYLKAIKILKEQNMKVELDVFGNGALENIAKKYTIRNKLAVNFKGFITDIEAVLPNYRFALVSRYLAILESMAVQLPVISHYNNAIKKDYLEMSPFAKYISISNEPKIIADKIKFHLENNEELKNGAYAWVKSQTWEKMADIYLSLWGLRGRSK